MELVLIRHADTESGASYADDALRPLTARGRQTHEQVARALRQRGFSPDVILCSPRVRAGQTAWITAQALPAEVPIVEVPELDGGFAVDSLIKRLQAYPELQCIACVGHEPDMTLWTHGLLASQQRPIHSFSKSGVASISFRQTPALHAGHLNYAFSAEQLLAE